MTDSRNFSSALSVSGYLGMQSITSVSMDTQSVEDAKRWSTSALKVWETLKEWDIQGGPKVTPHLIFLGKLCVLVWRYFAINSRINESDVARLWPTLYVFVQFVLTLQVN